MSEWFNMGGYGGYVWSSYGLALVVMGYTLIKPMTDKKAVFKELTMKYRREDKS